MLISKGKDCDYGSDGGRAHHALLFALVQLLHERKKERILVVNDNFPHAYEDLRRKGGKKESRRREWSKNRRLMDRLESHADIRRECGLWEGEKERKR